MATPFLGQIALFGFDFAPTGWAIAAGQLLPISRNTALFSLLGPTFGGDGKSNFALPNLSNGLTPVGVGQGPGLSLYDLGQTGGETSITLSVQQMPNHNHLIGTVDVNANYTAPAQALLANSNAVHPYLPSTTALNQQLNPNTIVPVGGGLSHDNLQPYLTLNFCIALQGIFPTRG